MEIRLARLEDVKAIKGLLVQLGYESSIESLATAIDSPAENSELFVAVSDTDVLAFMSLIYFYYFPASCNICRITGITVNASSRGSGIGTKLIDFARKRGQEYGCQSLEVTTSFHRESTQKYYESLGFKKVSYRYIQPIAS